MGGGLRARPTALLVPSQLLALPDYVDQPALVSGLRRPAVRGSSHRGRSPPRGLIDKDILPPGGGGRWGGGLDSPGACGPPELQAWGVDRASLPPRVAVV